MLGCNLIDLSLAMNKKLKKRRWGNKVGVSNYRSLIGNLLYLTSTRPNTMFAASLLSRFMNDPSHIHLGVAKRVLSYIQDTLDYGIKYESKVEVKLIDFCDNDWADCMDDMKRTPGYAFSLGSSVFSWC